MIGGTVMIWARALSAGRALDEQRDAPRIRRAFITLQAEAKEWPLPRDLINALPQIQERPAQVLRIHDEAQRERNKERLAAILESLGGDMQTDEAISK